MNVTRARKTRWVIVISGWLLLLLVSLAPAGFYLPWVLVKERSFANGRLKVSVFAPQYASAWEEQDIRVSIENVDPADAYVRIHLVNEGPATGFLISQDSNSLYEGSIKRGEQVNRQLRLFFPQPSNTSTSNTPTGLALSGAASAVGANKGDVDRIDLPIRLAPIPKTKSTTYYLFAAWGAIALWMAKEWWEQTKHTAEKPS